MRTSQKSSRARGRGGRKPNGSSINRVYESAGPEGKVRGTPQQIIDKYLSLARDAQTSGDRVVAENFLQHAEHYQRILIEALGARQERRDNPMGDQEQPDVDMQDESELGDVQESPPFASPAQSDGRRRDGERGGERGDGRGGGQSLTRPMRETEVSGLTTIDSGEGDVGSLLVDAEELGASQPRRCRVPPRAPSREEDDATPATVDADAPSSE